jgi:hypothetical protein
VRVGAAQRRDFETRGWFHLGRVFDDAALAEIRGEYDRIFTRPLELRETGKTPFHYNPLLHLQSPLLRRYATSRELAEVAIDLIGPDVRLYWDQAVSKVAGATSDIPWHQDNGYTPVVPEQYLTFTVALDATTAENGCLWIQPGSHHGGVRPHRQSDAFFFRAEAGEDPGVAVPQPAGDVLCFSSLTMHRTGPNRTVGPRRSWVIQLCDAATHHRETGKPFDDRLWVAKDGVPVAEPWSERPFDLSVFATSAKHAGAAAAGRKT